jgi:ubiquinone/menaquinone biosynthesis C-methylase UbiE
MWDTLADYARIALTYDDLAVRHDIPLEPVLSDWARAEPPRVLDVGCGTGLFLARQAGLPCGPRLAGVDPSPEMLARARARLPTADLRVAFAESLPFAAGAFDFVAVRFCHHHFADRRAAFAELARVLAPGGAFALVNIDPPRMPGHWIFGCFPEARRLDVRYPSATALLAELAAVGLVAAASTYRQSGVLPAVEALRQARVRDQTHLAALDDRDYARGLDALATRVEARPAAELTTESCVVTVRGGRAG